MKLKNLIALLFLSVTFAGEWAKNIGTEVDETVLSSVKTSDGGFLVVGFRAGENAMVLKLDQEARIEWQKEFLKDGVDFFTHAVETRDGGYLLVGVTQKYGKYEFDIWIVKLTPEGVVEWEKVLGGIGNDMVGSVYRTEDGGFVVVGTTESIMNEPYSTNVNSDIFVVKLDKKGNIEWMRTYGGQGGEEGSYIIQTSDGGYLIVGKTGFWNWDLWVLKTDPNGEVEWEKTIGINNNNETPAFALELEDGYLIGGSTRGVQSDWLLIKIDRGGNVISAKTYGSEGEDILKDGKPTSDGGLVFVGSSNYLGSYDLLLLKVGVDLIPEWARTFGWIQSDSGVSVHPDTGGIYVIGNTYSFSAGASDLWILKTDVLGTIENCSAQGSPQLVVNTPALTVEETSTEGVIFYTSSISLTSEPQLLEYDPHCETASVLRVAKSESGGCKTVTGTCGLLLTLSIIVAGHLLRSRISPL